MKRQRVSPVGGAPDERMTDVEPPHLRQTDPPEAVRHGTRLRRTECAAPGYLGFEERLVLLVEHEVSERHGKALAL